MTREQLEAKYLTALAKRDMAIWRTHMRELDGYVSQRDAIGPNKDAPPPGSRTGIKGKGKYA